MAGTRKIKDYSSDFWCINCGCKGIPIVRNRGALRKPGHRKALYCVHCKMRINHVETRSVEEVQQFMEDYAAGKYKEEAEQSVKFAQGNK